MDQKNQTEKKQKGRSRAGLVWLIILLLLMGGAGFLYYTVVKAPLELDDPWKLAAATPMPAEERFVFSASDKTVAVKLDKGDIWDMILDIAGDDFIENINKEIATYDLSVSGCAICMDEEGLRIDLECQYKEIHLVAKVPCQLEVTGHRFTLTPTAVKLGVLKLPVAGLLSKLNLEYDLVIPVIDDITQIQFVQDAAVLTGSLEQDVYTLVPLDEKLDHAVVFCDQLHPFVKALQRMEGDAAAFAYLQQNPASVEKLYQDLFTLTDADAVEQYLEDRDCLIQRFFPKMDFSAIGEKRESLNTELPVMNDILEKFFTHVANTYSEKKFQLSDGEFLKKGTPFQAAEFGEGKYDALFEVLDPESVFLILVDAEDGYLRKTSSLYRMMDENQQFTQSVDMNKTYILGCVLRSVDGEPYLLYEAERTKGNTYYRQIVLRGLTENDVNGLQEAGKFGVWTD